MDEKRELRSRIRRMFSEKFEKDPEVERIYKMIRNRSADYADAQRFAISLGDILTEVLQSEDYTGVNLYELAEDIVNMLNQNVRLVDQICDVIQGQMNESAKIGIEPVKPSTLTDRVQGIRDMVINAEGNEEIYNAVAASAANYGQAYVDEWVKTNAEFQIKSGLGATIVRVWSGSYPSHDTKRTDYCRELAGVYQYDGGVQDYSRHGRMWSVEGGKNIFARHKGCRCTVSFYPAGTSKGTITALAKGEKDINKQLWNTGEVFSDSRKAQLRRRREQYGKEEARKILNEEWKGGYNGNAERHF